MSIILFPNLLQVPDVDKIKRTHKTSDQHREFSLYSESKYHKTETATVTSFQDFLNQALKEIQ